MAPAVVAGSVAASATGAGAPSATSSDLERKVPEHGTSLITTIAAGLVLAFGFGLAAHRLHISPLVGYLLAGILVGPFTPGFVADQELANQLAEIGVILLLFAVGLHFSVADLISVRATALPGAIGQLAVSTLLGTALAWSFGWAADAGLLCSAWPLPAAAQSSSRNRCRSTGCWTPTGGVSLLAGGSCRTS